jgi:hypothetical protein
LHGQRYSLQSCSLDHPRRILTCNPTPCK